MRSLLCVWGFVIMSLSGFSQFNYAVSNIPKSLLSRAGAVVVNSNESIEVKALDEVIYKGKKVISILNAASGGYGHIYMYYDKTRQIKSVKGIIYNEMGLPVSKFNDKDFRDQSAVSDFSLYEDNRVKYFHPAITSYPYTIEYEYEIKEKQSFYFPDWTPADDTNVAILSSSLNVVCPASFNLRFKEINYRGKAEISKTAETSIYKWSVSNLPAIKNEPYSPDRLQYLTIVKLAPQNFAYRNIKGSFTSWKDYGKWINDNLLIGRQELPESTKNQVAELVKDINAPKEKARKVYEYMQNKTRYISVQIGIGGWQPYPAAEVDRLGYGDCKGLVNYTKALLQAAGVESYYSVVKAGRFKQDILSDFTSLQGNHIILCLPFKNDTTWLECTSKYMPFGFLGDFTDGRQVLACTPEGGKLMRTPNLSAEDSKQIRNASFKIEGDGSIRGNMLTRFEGAQYNNHDVLLNEPYNEQIKKLPELYPLPNLEIESLEFKKDKGLKPATTETLKLFSGGYCSFNDGKIHIPLNLINKYPIPKEVTNRVNPFHIARGFIDEDTITYEIPEGYKLNTPADKKAFEKGFGSYLCDISISGNKIIYKRKLQLNEGTYKPEEYQEFVAFCELVADTDNARLILSK